ncbi:MAG: phosphopyruvate hydratase [bacterium]|nr:phosphopyruvate hydratase [bacterium]
MATIENLKARKILDSRGEGTIEVEITLSNGTKTSASVPQGKSKGSGEAVYVSPDKAIKNVEEEILPKIKGLGALKHQEIERILIHADGTPNKSNLGANSILATSIAILRAGAMSKSIPLWQHLRELYDFPEVKSNLKLLVNVINGGLHASNNLDFQEYLVIPRASSVKESEQIASSFYHKLREELVKRFGEKAENLGDEGGFAPDFKDNLEPFAILKEIADKDFAGKIDFGVDVAGSNVKKANDELIAMYRYLRDEYDILYLEDPFAEDDFESFAELKKEWPPGRFIVGDDLTVTNTVKLIEAKEKNSINGIIIKPNQIGSISEAIEAIKKAQEFGFGIFVSHRSGETDDDFIADLAYAVNATGIKLGSPAQGERMTKYNRLLVIEGENL